MGNNGSSSGAGNDPASPSSPNGSRSSSAATQRTQSLPLGQHHHHLRHRHHQSHQHCHQGHSDRRHTSNAAISASSPTRRPSSRIRQALPNFVNNMSAAIGQKLPWSGGASGGNKRRFHKSSPSHAVGNYQQSSHCMGGGGKSEKRSRSKTREHCRLFRELVTNWRLSDLHCLVVEFEAALALRELRRRADAARPSAACLKDDFSRLFHQINANEQHLRVSDDSSADAFLLLDGRTFAIHRAFLSRRCSFFRRLFRGMNTVDDSSSSSNFSYYNGGWRPTIPVTFPPSMTPLNAPTFALLLEYLYTGELASSMAKDSDDFRALIRFNDEQRQLSRDGSGRCGDENRKWTTLEDDIGAMLKDVNESNGGADALLIFTNSKSAPLNSSDSGLRDADFEQFDDPSMTLEDDPRSKRAPLLVVVDKQKTKCCQFKCHSVVLAARSPFFRAIIRKRRLQDEQKQQQDQYNHRQAHRRSTSSPFTPWRRSSSTSGSSSGLLEIVLDESVIPRQYAPVLLHAMYTDEVDLSLVMRDCVASAASCLTEVQAIAAGKCQMSPVDEATEIYQIARFLEFDKLAQGCEDVIISYISLESLASIYSWSTESYGSAYVRRHCVDYLCQEFSRFCASPLLFDTDETLLVEALKSDYVQASELEILNAIIRWGEHQLVRRIEEREPNILVGTTHSISRKGVKRADLSDEELKDILANLLPLIRVDYVLPPNHTILENAIFRGLISIPSVDLLSGSRGSGVLLPPAVAARRQHRRRHGGNNYRHSPSALVRSCSSSASPSADDVDTSIAMDSEHKARDHWSQPHRHSAGPRLFLPYLEESRALLEKRVAESPDQLSSLINHHPPVEVVSDRHFMIRRSNSGNAMNQFPDTLYMVDGMVETGARCSLEDMDTSEITVPPSSALIALKERVDRILRTSATVKRALACGCSYHRSGVLRHVRLRAIREFGLLDSTLAILDSYGCLVSPSAMEYERPSCSSAPLSPVDVGEGLQFVDSDLTGLDESDRYSGIPSPTKRRFRSQPELSQCDLTGCASACMDWPDLMASSLATAASMDGEYSALSHNRRAASFLSSSSAVDWLPAVAASPESSFSISPNATYPRPPAGTKHNDEPNREGNSEKEELRQQFVDLTQQICDLVVDGGRGSNFDEARNKEQSSPSSSASSSTSEPRRGQNTAV